MKNKILLIPDKPDSERDSLAQEWENRGGEVRRIGKFWIKPELGGKKVALYGYDSFCLVLAQLLDLEVLMPKDEVIASLPESFLKREIVLKQIREVGSLDFPKFVKPVIPKLFKAAVFKELNELQVLVGHLQEEEWLICSEVIEVEKEVRSFILDSKVMDLAYYEGKGDLESPRLFIESFLKTSDVSLPRTFVLDVGYNEKDQWFIIEFNSSWGAGLNFCDPKKVIDCISAATVS